VNVNLCKTKDELLLVPHQTLFVSHILRFSFEEKREIKPMTNLEVKGLGWPTLSLVTTGRERETSKFIGK
jgi:hypothetical protein